MARAPDPRIEQAKAMYLEGRKLIEIARGLDLPEGTVRRWKSTHKWESERSDKKSERSVKRKKGAQPGNKNSSGGPPRNKKAEKYGFFSKYLPDETREIFSAIDQADPLDLLWHQIQIAYAAIIRAQRIAYVKDQQDRTIERIGHKDGETVTEERWEVQQAWDKQNGFMKAQARAQGELRAMIKQYDEMLHKDWEAVSEEQKIRLDQIRAQLAVVRAQAGQMDEEEPDDGFLDALKGATDWDGWGQDAGEPGGPGQEGEGDRDETEEEKADI